MPDLVAAWRTGPINWHSQGVTRRTRAKSDIALKGTCQASRACLVRWITGETRKRSGHHRIDDTQANRRVQPQ